MGKGVIGQEEKKWREKSGTKKSGKKDWGNIQRGRLAGKYGGESLLIH
jgi:hypothetical protein